MLEVYNILSEVTGIDPPKRRVSKNLAKALVWPVYLLRVASGRWDFTWDPKTVDVMVSDRAYSVEKAERDLGYSPQYSLKDGLRETVEGYREMGML